MDSSDEFKWFTRIKVKVEKWIEFVGRYMVKRIFSTSPPPIPFAFKKMMIENLRHVIEHRKKGGTEGIRRKGERERDGFYCAVTRTMKMLFYIITKLSVFVFLHLPEFLMIIIVVTYKHSFGYFHLYWWSFDYNSANCFLRGVLRGLPDQHLYISQLSNETFNIEGNCVRISLEK